jgi:hypothetical protein
MRTTMGPLDDMEECQHNVVAADKMKEETS